MSGSPKSPFSKLSLLCKQKPLRVVLLGQCGVGKTALVVRFITKRFIGEYDPNLEKVYSYNSTVGKEMVSLEILDTAGHNQDKEFSALEMNIRWGEIFILMYAVTDKCSFDECNRLKFLINYNKNRKKRNSLKDSTGDVPVVLVGNKNDQLGERMVSYDEGLERSKEIGCFCFHEISVRESITQVNAIFGDLWQYWKMHAKFPKLKRSESDAQASAVPPWNRYSDWKEAAAKLGNTTDEDDGKSLSMDNCDELDVLPPFRGRASTDGRLLVKPNKREFSTRPAFTRNMSSNRQADRRMSISMRGNNITY
uniref:small monomeric GTPase n=1 Tax=Lygus hesperus TaxID=30085 RepID=A0A0A9Z1I0_LYGHE